MTEKKPEVSHALRVVEYLDSQRKAGSGTDVVLVCGKENFPAHKLVLSATSEYFRTMFSPGWDESGKRKIELPTISSKEMEILLPFLYTGNVTDVSDPDLLKALMKTSHMLELKVLFDYCYKELCNRLSCNIFLELINLTALYNDEEMTKYICTFLAKNFTDVSKTDEFLTLESSQLHSIVDHMDASGCPIDDIIKSLFHWAEVKEDHQDPLANILTKLNLKDVTNNYLMELLKEEPLVKKNRQISSLLSAEATNRWVEEEMLKRENGDWRKASNGSIPDSALEGGWDGEETLYVGRAEHNGDLIPGKVLPSHRCCYVGRDYGEHAKNSYEVLCNSSYCSYEWVSDSDGNVPPGAVQGGASCNGEALFVGRVQHEGTMTIGKVVASHSGIYIPYGGAEHHYDTYEVLTRIVPQHA